MIIQNLIRKEDSCGFMMELCREDIMPSGRIHQSMMSIAKTGTLKAWHSHVCRQDDYLVIVEGEAVVVYLDAPYDKFIEHQVSGKKPQLLYIPGNSWHGVLSLTTTTTIYFITKLSDHKNQNELRLSPDHEFGFGAGKYDWKKWII